MNTTVDDLRADMSVGGDFIVREAETWFSCVARDRAYVRMLSKPGVSTLKTTLSNVTVGFDRT